MGIDIAALASQLINLGSAGAVIIVTLIFLSAQEKRDKAWAEQAAKRDQEWRDFFDRLDKKNCDDNTANMALSEKIHEIVNGTHALLKEHDNRVVQRINQATRTVIDGKK